MKYGKYLAIALIAVLAALSRLIPHIPNFAPITALAIFSGAYLSKKEAVGLTLLARFVSDLFLGFFAWQLMLVVYAAHLVGVLFGIWIKNSSKTSTRWIRIGSSSLVASTIFFLATNFAFLYTNYSHNWSGILLSYVNGLPFFRGTLVGDLSYTIAIFGLYEVVAVLAKSRLARKAEVQI